ncbi:MAG: hypothetical protein V3T86_17610 [Planctomycetota bacterium]
MIGLLAGNAHAGLVEECSRAFRKKDPAVRVGALQDAGRLVAEADDKSRNKAASSVARGLKNEPVTNVRLAAFDLLLMLRTDRALDRLVVGVLDPHSAVQQRISEIVRDHADPRLQRAIVRTLTEDASWRMRAGMIELLLAGARRNARLPLVKALSDKHPGVRARAAEALERLTGRAFGLNSEKWIEFLAKAAEKAAGEQNDPNQETKTVADSTRKVKIYEGPIRGVVPRLYGIPIRAKRVVFVIDMSSSMRDGKRSLHFQEFKRALFGLSTDVKFNVLCFDQRMFFFSGPKTLEPATIRQKAKAERWINDLPAGEQTDVTRSIVSGLAMLKEALSKEPKMSGELFLVTDGHETSKSMPQRHVRRQFDMLPLDRATVHLVALGRKGTPWLRTLAEDSGGQVVTPGR